MGVGGGTITREVPDLERTLPNLACPSTAAQHWRQPHFRTDHQKHAVTAVTHITGLPAPLGANLDQLPRLNFLPPPPLLRTSGLCLPQAARRSASPPAPGACRKPSRTIHLPPRFPGRRTEGRSPSLAKPTRTSAIPIKPSSRYWTLTAGKSANCLRRDAVTPV